MQTLMTLAVGTSIIAGPAGSVAAGADARQYYQVRVYSTSSDEQRQRVNDYWQNAAIPAYNRMGIRPVGVFTEQEASATNKIYVLIPCDSLKVFGAIPGETRGGCEISDSRGRFFGMPTKTNAAYDRYESTLLVAFEGMKHLAVPPADKQPNIFELRTKLSPGESKGLNIFLRCLKAGKSR